MKNITKKNKGFLLALLGLFGFTASWVDFSNYDLVLPIIGFTQSESTQVSTESLFDLPEYGGGDVVIQVNDNLPSFTSEELSLTEGAWQTFADLDSLNRVGVAEAMLHKELMPTEERGDISNVYPTGWNQKKLDNGVWLYNRSHSIGHQMTGEDANWKNLFTGTQQLNQIHMVKYENEVANYLRQTNNHVRYRVTPLFRDQELLPRAIQMEARSIENNDVQFNVLIYNVQEGVTLDYATGAATVQ